MCLHQNSFEVRHQKRIHTELKMREQEREKRERANKYPHRRVYNGQIRLFKLTASSLGKKNISFLRTHHIYEFLELSSWKYGFHIYDKYIIKEPIYEFLELVNGVFVWKKEQKTQNHQLN